MDRKTVKKIWNCITEKSGINGALTISMIEESLKEAEQRESTGPLYFYVEKNRRPSVYRHKIFFGEEGSHICPFYIKGRAEEKDGIWQFYPLVFQSSDMIMSGKTVLENVHTSLRKNETYLYVIFKDNGIAKYNVLTGEQMWKSKIKHIRTRGTDFTYEVYGWDGKDFEEYVPVAYWEDSYILFFDKDTGKYVKNCLIEPERLGIWKEINKPDFHFCSECEECLKCSKYEEK